MSSEIPHDFIAYRQLYITPRRYVRQGVNKWHELRWSNHYWNFYHECDDAEVVEEYKLAKEVYTRHGRRQINLPSQTT